LKKGPAKPSDDYLSGLDLPPSSDEEEEVERREVEKGPLVVQVREGVGGCEASACVCREWLGLVRQS
jgi:hypothetical protein